MDTDPTRFVDALGLHPASGAMQIVASELPAIANTFRLALTGAQGYPVLSFGDWINPLAVCPSWLGVDSATVRRPDDGVGHHRLSSTAAFRSRRQSGGSA